MTSAALITAICSAAFLVFLMFHIVFAAAVFVLYKANGGRKGFLQYLRQF